MARFRVHRGSLSRLQEDGSRKDYVIGDELEMSLEEGLRRRHQVTLLDHETGIVESDGEKPVTTFGSAIAAPSSTEAPLAVSVDWTNILKSSSVSKILLLVKNSTDRNDLVTAFVAEQKGQNRAKITKHTGKGC